MSFSVSAPSFVPPSKPSQWAVAAGDDIAQHAASGCSGGQRRVVCSVFYQTGSCSDGDFCSFAHHVDELEADAQTQLFATMGDAVPMHFVAPRGAAATGGAFTPPGLHSQRNAGGTNRRAWRHAAADVPPPPPLSADDHPRVHLPPRCRYPHAVAGTYYDHLNVHRTATQEAIEEAYRQWRTTGYRAAKSIDPLKADAVDRLVVDAKNVLSNETMRAEYDAQLKPSTPVSQSPSKKPGPPGPAVNTPISASMFEDLWR